MALFYRIISLLGGLALFLYGMRTMGEGLKSSSGGALRAVLAKVTGNPLRGFLLGTLVTCMIQSSTATIVLTVGLVGAGFLGFRQSVSIVLGANVGTAITAQIIRLMDLDAGTGSLLYFFKSDNLAPMALLAGIVLLMFVKGRWSNPAGTVLVGFGLLFVGLMDMSAAVSSMEGSLSGLLVSFEGNYVLGFLAGVMVTGVIQSSSAVVGILQSLASTVGITFCGVFPVIVGVNIGDCLTTYLVCRAGANREQVRTCLVHIVYNVLAAALILGFIAIARSTGLLGDEIWYAALRSGGIANVHGLFRLLPAVLLLPFSGMLADFCERLLPPVKTAPDADALRELDEHLITNPGMALTEVQTLISHMGDLSIQSCQHAVAQLFGYETRGTEEVRRLEEQIDRMADASNRYLISIGPYIKLEQDYRNQIYQIKALTCFERIGDLAINITDNVEALREKGERFSDTALQEVRVLTDAVEDILGLTRNMFQRGDAAAARRVEPLEEVIDELVELLRGRSFRRSVSGDCTAFSSIEYQNVLANLERISDQCSDLAVYLLGKDDNRVYGHEHEYIRELHHANRRDYLELFQKNRALYFGRLEEPPAEGRQEQRESQGKNRKKESAGGA